MEVARLKGKLIFSVFTLNQRTIKITDKNYFISVSVALRDEELKRVRVAQMADRQRAAAISIER